MRTRIDAYLTFAGNCREAMLFYRDCFGGKLMLVAIKDSPVAAQWPADMQHNILQAGLQKGYLSLLGSDIAGPEGVIRGNHMSLALQCSSEEEVHHYFARLAAGGKITHAPHRFGDGTIGALTDKFGINWVLKY